MIKEKLSETLVDLVNDGLYLCSQAMLTRFSIVGSILT